MDAVIGVSIARIKHQISVCNRVVQPLSLNAYRPTRRHYRAIFLNAISYVRERRLQFAGNPLHFTSL